MSRFNLPQDQIDSMGMESVSRLLNEMQDEMCELAALEYKLYTRRRKLEEILHPEMFTDQEPLQEPEIKKLDEEQLKALLHTALSRGINLKDLI